MTTDEKLLTMMVEGKQCSQAPTKQTRTPEHRSYIFGIGSDNYAELIIHEDAVEALKELNKLDNKKEVI